MSVKYRQLPLVSTEDSQRFWSNVNKRGTNECWPWLASVNRHRGGYGRFWIKRVEYRTNRMAFWLHYGIDPKEQEACHVCDNPPCCNPAHLFKGTRADNHADMRRKNRQPQGATHGLRLHPECIARGNKLPHAKMTVEKVQAIRAQYESGGAYLKTN